jgi:hypothetical protein
MSGKASVSLRALILRINRKLKTNNEVLKMPRGDRQKRELGDFYIFDSNRDAIIAKDVDPESYGREIGVLRAWEQVGPS